MKTLIVFFPSIESGGVEKNFYYLINHFSLNFEKIIIITSSHIKKKLLPKKIEYLKPKSSFWWNKSRFIKSVMCFFLALRLFTKKNILIYFSGEVFNLIIILHLNNLETIIEIIFD